MTSPAAVDMDHLNQWLGNSETAHDIVTPGLVDRFTATFGARLYTDGPGVPAGLHWCLAPPAVAHDAIGLDGHPARGGFLPPVPFENRMWAGGQVTFCHPISAGDTVTRTSRIASITPKQGRSGPLVFVSVIHDLSVGERIAIKERQDIVYRPARRLSASHALIDAQDAPPEAYVADSVTLFRYSAMTFNGHRIHYDYPYVTQHEGYPGLVVHGPLQATLLMNAAMMRAGTDAIQVDYRGLSPLIAAEAVSIRDDGDRIWLEKPDGTVTFDARYCVL